MATVNPFLIFWDWYWTQLSGIPPAASSRKSDIDFNRLGSGSIAESLIAAPHRLTDADIKAALADMYTRIASLERQSQFNQAAILRIEKLLLRSAS
ncbi:MAG: hypothetical protein DMF06_15035 [Verrucomicrobia bacterium]|nr:MAG: hypothetical protein DMF06_15035 [Verrucomicrobiota bacterium]